MTNPNRLRGQQIDYEYVVPFVSADEMIHPHEDALAENYVHKHCTEGLDIVLSALGMINLEVKSEKVKRCPSCRENKLTTEYYKAIGRSDNLSTYCKPCHNKDIKKTRLKRHRKGE